MPRKAVPREHYHMDGTLRATGQTLDGEMHGYWEWFRKSGVIMRSGHFAKGVQTGEWTTYDHAGKVYKVTRMKSPKS
jgi:antitoxin component YwqK of YwqJK toxin-antitoxin module